MSFGAYLKQLRNACGMSLREVEALTGLSFAVISQYELDKATPGAVALLQLCKCYGVPMEEAASRLAQSKGVELQYKQRYLITIIAPSYQPREDVEFEDQVVSFRVGADSLEQARQFGQITLEQWVEKMTVSVEEVTP